MAGERKWLTKAMGLISRAGVIGQEFFRCEDRALVGEDLFGQYPVDFLVRVEAGVLDDETLEIQITGRPDRRQNDAAGRDPEKHQVLNPLRPQDHLKGVPREGADAVLIDEG